MRDSSLASLGQNDRLDDPLRTLLGQPSSLTPEQFLELGRGLRWAAESWPGVWQPITRLNNRFDQLWCTLVHELGEPVPGPHQYFLERARMRMSEVVGRFDLYSAEVLGNPLLRPRLLEELLESRPVKVKPPEDWPSTSEPYEVQERWEAEFRHREAEAKRLGRPVSLMGGLDYRVLGEARKTQEKSQGQQDPSLGVELPRSFEEFLALVEAAFGESPEGRSFSSAATAGNYPLTRPSDTLSLEHGGEGRGEGESVNGGMDPRLRGGDAPVNGDPLSDSVIPAKAGIHESSDEPRKPNPEPRKAPTLRDLAQLLWDSATLPRRRAEEEARLLADYLTEYAALLASRDPKDVRRRRRVADSILTLFRQGVTQQEKNVQVTRRARLAMHDIAVERYGRRPEWEPELLCLNDRFKQHQSEFFDLYFGGSDRQAAAGDG